MSISVATTKNIEDLIKQTNVLITQLSVLVTQINVLLNPVATDALKAADLNIQAGSKDLQVDVLTLPAVTGAVTTDALKASELNIDPAEKLLEVAIVDAIARLLMNSPLYRAQLDVAGRLLVKIDVGGTATPVTTATHAVTVVAGGIALGALATGAITDFPYRGPDHEKVLAEAAFQTIRSRMEFTS